MSSSLDKLIAELCEPVGDSFTLDPTYDLRAEAADRLAILKDALEECRLIVANLPHGEELLLAKIDKALV